MIWRIWQIIRSNCETKENSWDGAEKFILQVYGSFMQK